MSASGKKSVLIVSAVFPPVSTSGIHRMIRAVRYLTELGVDVTVLTVDEKTLPKRFKYDEKTLAKIPDSVHIERVPAIQLLRRLIDLKNRRSAGGGSSAAAPQPPVATAPQNGTAAPRKRLLQKVKDTLTWNLNTPDNFAMWIYPAIRAGEKLMREKNIGNILSSSPPGSTHVVAHALQQRTGAKWIADFRDPWSRKRWHNPEMTPFKRRMIKKYERRTIDSADALIMNTPELLADFRERYGAIVEDKSTVIMNGFDPADFAELPETNGREPGPLEICHAGTFYRNRSPRPFLEALVALRDQGKLANDRFRVRFIGGLGDLKSELGAYIAENGLQDVVEVIPPLPHQECLASMRKADVLLIVQPVTGIQIPAKIFEYMASGKPILAVSAAGATANVVIDNKLGWWADFEDTGAIGEQLLEIDRFYAENNGSSWSVDSETMARFDGRNLVKKIDALLREDA